MEDLDLFAKYANAFPPTQIEDLKISPFYEGVLLSWEPPADFRGAPILEYIVRYTAVEHKQKKKKTRTKGGTKEANNDDDNSQVSDTTPLSLEKEEVPKPQEIRITGKKEETNSNSASLEGKEGAPAGAGDPANAPSARDPPPPTTVRVENLKGGFDYIFYVFARNAKGCSEPVISKQVSPSAVVVAKTKEDLPKIFNRFGIDLSKADNVKKAMDILWSRYEKNEFYFEVNGKKKLVMHVIRLDIFVQRNGSENEIEVVVETYSQTNDERLREINEVPHKILRKTESWQRAIRKIAADLFVVDEEDMKLLR